MGIEACESRLGSEPGLGAGRGQPGTQGRPGSPWQRAAAPRSLQPPPQFGGLMAKVSRLDGLQGASTGPAGVPLQGRGNNRGRAMTFQVWGRRREASHDLAWVPDAEGGRGTAMRRRTPGEPSVRVLAVSGALGQSCCLGGREAGRQGRGCRPRQDAGTRHWPSVGAATRSDASASPGGARLRCKRS